VAVVVPMRILVVDDEQDVADVIKIGLQRRGFSVDVYYDPIKAVANFRPGEYDLLISDIKMPGMNGFEMVFEMKKQDNALQVIFLTGYVDLMQEVNKLFSKLDIREVIQKPIGIQELVNKISRLDLVVKAKPTSRPPDHDP
jgi:DNA-binding response OmpR family regulator